MRDKREFDAILKSIDGKDPSQYAALTGDFDFTRFVLHNIKIADYTGAHLDTLFVIHVPQLIAGFPPKLFDTAIRRTALEDFLARKVSAAIEGLAAGRSDGPTRRSIRVSRPGAEILPRSSLIVAHDYVEARITIRLPVREGVISGAEAEQIFFDELPAVVNQSLIFCYLDEEDIAGFVNAMEDADAIRRSLLKRGMVGFLADGTDLGAGRKLAVAEDRLTTMDAPNAGSVGGLGLPAGVTLVVGDAYSGRTELVDLLAAGIYNHPPGDGREFSVAVPDAVQVVAEPRRPVHRLDLSPFLGARAGCDPARFTSASASPAESQMASTVEALQVGAQVLLFDEASSDASFLVSDDRLSALKPGLGSRVTPLCLRARKMADELRVSIVVGASACAAEFVPAADAVLFIEDGRVTDITREAKELGIKPPAHGAPTAPIPAAGQRSRWIVPSSIDSSLGKEDAAIRAVDRSHLQFGRSVIDLSGVRQLLDKQQTTAIGLILYYAKLHYLDESRSVAEVMDLIDQDLASEGLDMLSRELRGDLARPRRFEIAAALNRLDTLRVTDAADKLLKG